MSVRPTQMLIPMGPAVTVGEPQSPWTFTHKGDERGREMADLHYTRQSPGHRQWTRPGFNLVLYAEHGDGSRATFVWWCPKWPEQERKDGLRAIECTIFRLDRPSWGGAWRASDLVNAACMAVTTKTGIAALGDRVRTATFGLITGVGSAPTAKHRSKTNAPGHCFRMAGFVDFEHRAGVADVWLRRDVPREV